MIQVVSHGIITVEALLHGLIHGFRKGVHIEFQTAAGMVSSAKQLVENLTVDQVVAELAHGGVSLIDIREPEEWAASGRIPGAVHAARGMLEFYADPASPSHLAEFQTDRRIILHCASGGRSALAADTLQKLGFTRVAHLDGGIKAWSAAGQPVE